MRFSSLSAAVAIALSSSFSAMAQDSVDLPISARVIVASDHLKLELLQGASLGSVARSSTSNCYYRVKADGAAAQWLDETGNAYSPGDSFGEAGCGSVGPGQIAKLNLTCIQGTEVQIVHPTKKYVDEYTDVYINSVRSPGVESSGSAVGDEFITTMSCANDTEELLISMPLEVSPGLTLFKHHRPNDYQLDTSIPLEVRY